MLAAWLAKVDAAIFPVRKTCRKNIRFIAVIDYAPSLQHIYSVYHRICHIIRQPAKPTDESEGQENPLPLGEVPRRGGEGKKSPLSQLTLTALP